jgi:hypothetical protein
VAQSLYSAAQRCKRAQYVAVCPDSFFPVNVGCAAPRLCGSLCCPCGWCHTSGTVCACCLCYICMPLVCTG